MLALAVCTYREGDLTQFVCPVVQLLPVHGEHVDLLRGLDHEGSRVFGTAVSLHLRHPDTVRHTDHLGDTQATWLSPRQQENSVHCKVKANYCNVQYIQSTCSVCTFLCSCCLRRFLSSFSTLPTSLHSKNSSLEIEQELSLYRTHHTRFHFCRHTPERDYWYYWYYWYFNCC